MLGLRVAKSLRLSCAAVLVTPVVLTALGLVAYLVLSGNSAFVQSISPDGTFRCTVIERSEGLADPAWEITVDKFIRESTPGSDEGKRRSIERASGTLGSLKNYYYSICWQYDTQHRTTGVAVFGSNVAPSGDGRILWDMPLKQ
jgi:hypothetical protein